MARWAMATGAFLIWSAPVSAQDYTPASTDISYPDFENTDNRVIFQRSGEASLTEIAITEGSASIVISYNKTPLLTVRHQDYPGGAYLVGPIVAPAGSRFELDKPLTILKGSPVYVLVVLKTGIAACTQYGLIMDVTSHFPTVTSKLHLCQAKVPLIGIHADGTVEVLLKSYRPNDNRPDRSNYIKMTGMPAQRYVFKTGDADVVRTNFPVMSAAEASKIEAQTDIRVKQELDRNPYNRPDPLLSNFFDMIVTANKALVARQEYCQDHAEECREEAQRAADLQDRINQSQQQYQQDFARQQQQYMSDHGR